MDDEAYARELFRILTRPLDPDEPVDAYGMGRDGIDRYQGFGTELRVASMDVIPGPYGAQVEVGFALEVPAGYDAPASGSVLLPVAREWREAQGYVTAALHAPDVASQVERAAGRSLKRAEPGPTLPDREVQADLLREVRERHPDTTIVVTPDEWEQIVQSHHGRPTWILEDVSELVASRHRDDRFLVFWEGELVRSVRQQLPPVSGTLRALLAMRAAGPPGPSPGKDFGWFAYEPAKDDELPG